jgi:hypothetical protein
VHDGLRLLCQRVQLLWNSAWHYMIVRNQGVHKDTITAIINLIIISNTGSIGFIKQYFALFDYGRAIGSCKPTFEFSRFNECMEHSCFHLACKHINKNNGP